MCYDSNPNIVCSQHAWATFYTAVAENTITDQELSLLAVNLFIAPNNPGSGYSGSSNHKNNLATLTKKAQVAKASKERTKSLEHLVEPRYIEDIAESQKQNEYLLNPEITPEHKAKSIWYAGPKFRSSIKDSFYASTLITKETLLELDPKIWEEFLLLVAPTIATAPIFYSNDWRFILFLLRTFPTLTTKTVDIIYQILMDNPKNRNISFSYTLEDILKHPNTDSNILQYWYANPKYVGTNEWILSNPNCPQAIAEEIISKISTDKSITQNKLAHVIARSAYLPLDFKKDLTKQVKFLGDLCFSPVVTIDEKNRYIKRISRVKTLSELITHPNIDEQLIPALNARIWKLSHSKANYYYSSGNETYRELLAEMWKSQKFKTFLADKAKELHIELEIEEDSLPLEWIAELLDLKQAN